MGCNPQITNNTIVNNFEYGLQLKYNSSPEIKNSILYSNGETFFIDPGGFITSPSVGFTIIQDQSFGHDFIVDLGSNLFSADPQ